MSLSVEQQAYMRWAAVYGAAIGAQIQDEVRLRGWGAIDDATMERFVEEAKCIADMAEEAFKK